MLQSSSNNLHSFMVVVFLLIELFPSLSFRIPRTINSLNNQIIHENHQFHELKRIVKLDSHGKELITSWDPHSGIIEDMEKNISSLFDVNFVNNLYSFKSYQLFSNTEKQHLITIIQRLETLANNDRKQSSTSKPYFSTLPEMWQVLSGNWILLYSNVPTIGLSSTGLGLIRQVSQRISEPDDLYIDNILKFADSSELTLHHKARIASNKFPAEFSIELIDISLMNASLGGCSYSLPLTFNIPFLGSSCPLLRTGYFDVTFVSDVLRISRGNKGELRLFLKDTS